MCGIAGYLTKTAEEPRGPGRLAAMLATLESRGPDAHGQHEAAAGAFQVGLGHRRLSIIDLSAAANQPMARARSSATYNGEIYNFVELRHELTQHGHEFSTASDTEVLLAAYEQWDTECVQRFNGMFAFAIWDAAKQRLFCARDRIGEKPLFFHASTGHLVFGSEIKAVLAFGAPVPRAPNLDRVHAFMRESWQSLSARTFFEGVEELLPGHTLIVDVAGDHLRVSNRPYWTLPMHNDRGARLSPDAVRDLLDAAVRLRLRSDVPIGTSLSGGVDSPSVVAAVHAQDAADAAKFRFVGIHAFAPQPGCDERPFVDAIAKHLSIEVEFVEITGEGCRAELDDLIYRQDEPFLGPSIYAQRCVFRRASEMGLKVMLDGQGADEMFGGYDWAVPKALAGIWRRQGLSEAMRQLRAFDSSRFPRLALIAQMVACRLRNRKTGLPDDLYRALRASLLSLSLPGLLRYADRNSMSFGVEARLPFLDVQLLEAAVHVTPDQCVRGGMTKSILREAQRRRLPARVLDRTDKTAFAVPEQDWLRGVLRDDVRAAADAPFWQSVANGPSYRARALNELDGGRYRRHAWKLLCVSRWHDRFFGPVA